ncbi:hypothetical protein [Sphingopyxis flava]|uniref:Uncharacterized protein n=1 Tax=Sphingopyxis flava TaxID=1507287 RepID=A0A1T5CV80_9SPHN|nr:hypothetical protein [Sphingopyxis flava]SKB63277.1 hypothetical protein SAMN06295937_1011142 [Sphingopyxis flava]
MSVLDPEIDKLTNCWIPNLPKAHEKSVVLGSARVLYPVADPEQTAAILAEHILEVARRAYQQGRRAAKEEIRKALFNGQHL